MTLSTPASQKAEDRPISFVLDAAGAPVEEHVLFIRPEDISRQYPSKLSVNQTLGGAWLDSFGEGLEVTTMSGITGWRAGPDGQDGIDRILTMRESVYTQWHALRAEAIARGENPDNIKLRIVDTLNRYARVIAPQVFEIRRSKSRPLLASYRITFTALEEGSWKTGALSSTVFDPSGFGVPSLTSSISTISGAISSIRNFVNGTLLAPVRSFMQLSNGVLSKVTSVINEGKSISGSLIGIARDIAHTGTNLFRTLAAIASTPMQVRAELARIGSAYSNALCVLKNALKPLPTYEDYQAIHGASNCSSTSGGRPPSAYAGINVFEAVAPPPVTPASVSPAASKAMKSMITTDVVFSPMSSDTLAATLTDINSGVVVA